MIINVMMIMFCLEGQVWEGIYEIREYFNNLMDCLKS